MIKPLTMPLNMVAIQVIDLTNPTNLPTNSSVGIAIVNGGQHVMTLDTITDGKFVFKKTYADNKQLEMAVDAVEAPEEFFFIHISFTPSSVKTRLKTTANSKWQVRRLDR